MFGAKGDKIKRFKFKVYRKWPVKFGLYFAFIPGRGDNPVVLELLYDNDCDIPNMFKQHNITYVKVPRPDNSVFDIINGNYPFLNERWMKNTTENNNKIFCFGTYDDDPKKINELFVKQGLPEQKLFWAGRPVDRDDFDQFFWTPFLLGKHKIESLPAEKILLAIPTPNFVL